MPTLAEQCRDQTLKLARQSYGTEARKMGAERVRWASGHSWIFPDGSVLAISKDGKIGVHS